MKVLWVTNTIFPELSKAIGKNAPVVGGWMYSLAQSLTKKSISLGVATVKLNVKSHKCIIDGTSYFLIEGSRPITDYDVSLEDKWKEVVAEFRPDIVHIHGTEYAHGLALMRACPDLKYVISIQGMTSIISRYYYAGIGLSQIVKNITLRDLIKGDGIISAKKKYRNRGRKVEKKYLTLATDIIGRTDWDHDHIKTINSSANYHFCNESLREGFYTSKKWDIHTKKDHTIFLSQAGYPIKGLHKVLEAVSLIKSEYKDIKIRVAGTDILKNSGGLKERLKRTGYGKYVNSLVRKFDLHDQIEFVGYLDEKKMIEEYLSCHIFICPSSIENSPNSLGEAQILGVPCIAAYVGGIPNSIKQDETGILYRFEEVEMLAQSITRVFNNEDISLNVSKKGIEIASERHDRQKNANAMIDIYKGITSSETL